MAHVHNAECRLLHEIVEGLVARQGIPAKNRLSDGVDVALLPSDRPSHPESDDSDEGNLDLEIEATRRALVTMGCSG